MGAGATPKISTLYRKSALGRFTDKSRYKERIEKELRGRNAIIWWFAAMVNESVAVFLTFLALPADQVLAFYAIERRRLFREGLTYLDISDYMEKNHSDLFRLNQSVASRPPAEAQVKLLEAEIKQLEGYVTSSGRVSGLMERMFAEITTVIDDILCQIVRKCSAEFPEVIVRFESDKYNPTIMVELYEVTAQRRADCLADLGFNLFRSGYTSKWKYTVDPVTRKIAPKVLEKEL